MIDPVIQELESTTFCTRRFTRKQIAEIQQTVIRFPHLSRRELCHTICEHFQWFTPNGSNKIQSCLSALEEMERLGILTLPTKRKKKKATQQEITWTDQTNEQAPIECALDKLMPITLQKVTEQQDKKQWNEFVDRYHYLRYRSPIGSHLRYYVIDRQGRKLGCLLFSFATRFLADRDQWIGWDVKAQEKNLKLVINNNRFLIFPWVKVKCLASKALSLVTGQVADDWQACHGYRPVLLETFVDPTHYKGTCYQASNWQQIGKTAGRKSTDDTKNKPSKQIYVYPLSPHFRLALIKGVKNFSRKKLPPTDSKKKTIVSDDPFVQLWQNIIGIVSKVANDFDQQWQKRQRVLNTMLIVLFIFRLVFSKNKQGYGVTINELWAQCHTMNIPLPQPKPVAASAFCNARSKLDENVFNLINEAIIHTYETTQPNYLWNNHRLFAVDGSKINLPRALKNKGYRIPAKNAYYPQGLVSCLYQLKSQIPTHFTLAAHGDERKAALTHLPALRQDDVVIYDRGYFSYVMLYSLVTRGIQAIFRLRKGAYAIIDDFIASHDRERIVDIEPCVKTQKRIHSKNPEIKCKPLRLRLIKYTHGETTYILGTTLVDAQRYKTEWFSDLYHARWGIEELYKISKNLIEIEDFHAQTERGVKQELFAHFVLITLSRIFSNHAEDGFSQEEKKGSGHQSKFKANVKNSLATIARHLEGLFLQQEKLIRNTIHTIMSSITRCRQRQRPNRSYKRESRRPIRNWASSNGVKSTQTCTQTISS